MRGVGARAVRSAVMGNLLSAERINTVVIGGGQAGLSVGHHLAKRGVPFVILDAAAHIGDAWRERWDSLRVFTPAKFAGLDGLRFPAPPNSFPTKDQMADYMQLYARTFKLPVRSGMRVDRLSRMGDRYVVTAGSDRFEADNVVVAMGSYQRPRVPAFAADLDPSIVQLHSLEYRNPAQITPGAVLVVGVGNSGAEIALELARHGHQTMLAGRDTGHIPFHIEGLAARLILARLVLRVVFHRLLTIDTPLGRRVLPKVHGGGPLIRLKPKELTAAGIMRASARDRRQERAAGARGRPRARRRERRLVHGLRSRIQLDRSPDLRRRRRARSHGRGRRGAAGTLLRRAPPALRVLVGDDPRRRARRGADCRDGRGAAGADLPRH